MEKQKKYLYMIYMVRHLRHLRHFPRCGDVKSWQYIIIQIYQDPGKNTSTCTKKRYFLIIEFQKNTIFSPISVYFLY